MGTRTRSLEALGSEMTASGPAAWYVLCMCVFVFACRFLCFCLWGIAKILGGGVAGKSTILHLRTRPGLATTRLPSANTTRPTTPPSCDPCPVPRNVA